MLNNKKRAPDAADGPHRSAISDRLRQFEKRQGELWRLTFFLLAVLSIGLRLWLRARARGRP